MITPTAIPSLEQRVSSLTGQIRHLLLASEENVAGLVIGDFMDQLAAAGDDQERMVICRRWQAHIRDIDIADKNFVNS